MDAQKIRTTVYLPASLMEAVKLEALSRKMPFTKLVEAGLRKEMGMVKKSVLKWGGYNLGMKAKKFNRSWAYE